MSALTAKGHANSIQCGAGNAPTVSRSEKGVAERHDYVKAGKRVPFCDNWARLCEAVGFKIIQRARCHLVKEVTHAGLWGDVTKKTERKSFFRRLHERKPGAVKIDWEEVVFAVKN